jgi:hypothetical protein
MFRFPLCRAALLGAALHGANAVGADAGHIEHEAHQHGIATLRVALDGGRLSIELESPAVDVLGFERSPRSPEELAAARNAEETLRDAGALFSTAPKAECRAVQTDLDTPDWSGNESHYEYEGRYFYECRAPGALTHIDVLLVTKLSRSTRVRAQVVTSAVQSETELTRSNTRLRLQ